MKILNHVKGFGKWLGQNKWLSFDNKTPPVTIQTIASASTTVDFTVHPEALTGLNVDDGKGGSQPGKGAAFDVSINGKKVFHQGIGSGDPTTCEVPLTVRGGFSFNSERFGATGGNLGEIFSPASVQYENLSWGRGILLNANGNPAFTGKACKIRVQTNANRGSMNNRIQYGSYCVRFDIDGVGGGWPRMDVRNHSAGWDMNAYVKFNVGGGMWAAGAGIASDARLKQDIRSLQDREIAVGSRLVKAIRTFTLNAENTGKKHVGVIAQDVIDIFADEGLDYRDYAVIDENEDGIYAVQYDAVISLILSSQQERVSRLAA